MNFAKVLERGRIQTKIIVLITPLLAGIILLALVGLLSGSMLDKRLEGTNASILTLGGYKRAQENMNIFLQDTTQPNRERVTRLLEEQVDQIDRNLHLASSRQDQLDLEKARGCCHVKFLWLERSAAHGYSGDTGRNFPCIESFEPMVANCLRGAATGRN